MESKISYETIKRNKTLSDFAAKSEEED